MAEFMTLWGIKQALNVGHEQVWSLWTAGKISPVYYISRIPYFSLSEISAALKAAKQ